MTVGGGRRKPVVIIAAAAALLGAALVAGYFEVRPHRTEGGADRFSTLLRDAQREIAGGFFDRARAPLLAAARLAASQDDWLSVCKRAYAIAKSTSSYSTLLDVSGRAVAKLPGSTELWAVRVLAEMRAGRVSEAVRDSAGHLAGGAYASLGTEAVLRGYPEVDLNSAKLGPEGRAAVEAISSRDPELFESIAQATGNNDFLTDAMLLRMFSGDLAGAYRLLVSLRDHVPAELGMLISYDAHHLDASMSYFSAIPKDERTPSLELLAADITYEQNNANEAATRYGIFIAQHPTDSWVPYLDLAWLDRQLRSDDELRQLKAAHALFPDQREVVLTLADYYREANAPSDALAVLDPYVKRVPSDLDAALLRLRVAGAAANPTRYTAELWRLFYESASLSPDDHARVARYLGWYLFGLHDDAGIALILKQMSADASTEWFLFYQGVRAALGGDARAAAERFKESLAKRERWQTRYNLGLAQLQSADYRSAIDSFQKADLAYQERERVVQTPMRAQIHVELARALDADGNLEAAKREALYALDLDPTNANANLLLQKLDTGE